MFPINTNLRIARYRVHQFKLIRINLLLIYGRLNELLICGIKVRIRWHREGGVCAVFKNYYNYNFSSKIRQCLMSAKLINI